MRRWLPYALAGGPLLALVLLRLAGVLDPSVPGYAAITAGTFLSLDAVTIGYLLRAGTHPGLDPAARRPWLLIGLGMLAVGIGASVYGASVTAGDGTVGDPALVLAYTAARVVMDVLVLAGLLRLTGGRAGHRARIKLALDCGTMLGGGLMVLWYTLAGPALADSGNGAAVRAIAVAWPLLDLVLLVGVCAVLLRGADVELRVPLVLLLAGLLVNLGVDLAGVARILLVPGAGPGRSEYVGLLSLALICAAGRERCLLARGDVAPGAGSRLRPHPSLPYLALALGYGLLALAAARSAVYPWAGLVLGAVLMTGTTAARQAIVVAENKQLSLTDGLTGLSNRLPLWGAIDRATARSRRSGTPMAVLLLDLDGFKEVNDEHGHEAGDAMLVGFATILLAAVRGTDVAVRLGGDEFAVVLEDVTGRRAITVAERVLERCAEPVRLGRRGPPDGLPIRCSIGIAVGDPLEPDGVPDPQELLHRADLAMYASKQSGSHGWRIHRPVPDVPAPPREVTR